MRRICFLIFAAAFLPAQPISQGAEPSVSNPSALLKTDGQKSMATTLRDVAGGNLYTLEYDQPYYIDDIMDSGGVNSSKALLEAVFSRLVNLPQAVSGGTPEYGCSIFSAKSPEGDVLVGRNFDFSFASSSNILVHNVLPGVRESVGITAMPFLDRKAYVAGALSDGKTDISIPVAASIYCCLDGMNDAGLFIGVLSLKGDGAFQHEEGKRDIVPTLAIRLILDRCANVDEAVELFRSHNFFADGETSKYNYHFLLADAGGRSVVVEYWRPDEGDWTLNVLEEDHVTNFYLSEGWRDIGGGRDRYDTLDSTLTAKARVMTEDEGMALLDAVHTDLNSEGGKITSNTQWSVVYNLTKKTAAICVAKDYSRKILVNL